MVNISSVVIDVRPLHVAAVQALLEPWPGVEVHAATPQGKLVVTVESTSDGDAADTFSRLAAIEGVMSVALVYHQFEPDPEQESRDGTDAT